MEPRDRERAVRVRALLESGGGDGASFRAALREVPRLDRDAWVDVVLGVESPPDDGPELPPGGVPYLPCPVDAVVRAVDLAGVSSSDVFVDIGAGLGRAVAVASLVSGARSVGIEVQSGLVAGARALAARLRLGRASFLQADAAALPAPAREGTVFFLYCPFSGERLGQLLGQLEALARARAIRVCCVDLPLPPCSWLEPIAPTAGDLVVYRSTAG